MSELGADPLYLDRYVGRFAPSPTGPLHAGSMIAALASHLDAKRNGGLWLVRIDDIDPPREIPGASKGILEALKAHGLNPDAIEYQSHHSDRFTRAIEQLKHQGNAFYCGCSRSSLGAGGVCVSACQRRDLSETRTTSLRVIVPPDTHIEFDDAIQGKQTFDLGKQHPNFIVRRKDGLFAYQLAAACDDGREITHVIRGCDLLESTPRQLFLQSLLGLSSPQYGHLPLVYGPDGHKLSKQTGAHGVNNATPCANLRAAAEHLGIPKAPSSIGEPTQLVEWYVERWHKNRVPR